MNQTVFGESHCFNCSGKWSVIEDKDGFYNSQVKLATEEAVVREVKEELLIPRAIVENR